MSKETLVKMAEHSTRHADAGTMEVADDVFRVPVENYLDEERSQREKALVFKRMPLLLGVTGELPNPGDYKACEAVGVPVIMTRNKQGEVKAFVNSCSHRGAQILREGLGTDTHRFTCPYHGWTFASDGSLMGVADGQNFGEIDKSCHGLIELKCAERAGLIWVILDPASPLDIDTFLCGYDGFLEHFGFKDWILFERRTLRGPNWKIAYDGYLDFYHLPILHKDTFGPDFAFRANYYSWGPHTRVMAPDRGQSGIDEGVTADQYTMPQLLSGVWTIFPHISIASFDGGGGRGVMLSQLMPGETALESFTTQYYLMEKTPNEEQKGFAHAQFKLLEYVVEEEDYYTGLKQQRALQTGLRSHVLFGRNEEGGQRFHGWLAKIMETKDEDLNDLFASAERYTGITAQAAE